MILDLSEVDIVVSKSNCLWNIKIMLTKQTTIVIIKWDSTSYWNGLVFLKSINSEPITMKSLLSEKFFNKFTQTSYKLNSKKSSLIIHLKVKVNFLFEGEESLFVTNKAISNVFFISLFLQQNI